MEKIITYFGQPMKIKCDEKCNKAWGCNSRPSIQLDPENEDDYCFLSDDELREAPLDPGTYEGGHGKPFHEDMKGNKWCVRECERLTKSKFGESMLPLKLHDFNKRFYNILRKNEQFNNETEQTDSSSTPRSGDQE